MNGDGLATTLAPVAMPLAFNPPGNQIVFQHIPVRATIGAPNVMVVGTVPIPGTLFGFVNVVNAVPGGWNVP